MNNGQATTYATVEVGRALPSVVKGPMTSAMIMRWSSATENWHRIHYDRDFAVTRDGLPDIAVNGSWKQQVLVQLMKDFLGHDGWLYRIKFEFRGMDVRGDTIEAFGVVTDKHAVGEIGVVECSIGLRNQRGEVNSSGTAVGLLPLVAGSHIPYPLPPGEYLRAAAESGAGQ